MIYLDHNATTPLDPRVAERIRPFLAEWFGNPASREHRFGWDAADAVEEARGEVAALVDATPAEIFFTSGATESINLALKGIAREGSTILTVKTEHAAVLEVCRQLERTRGTKVRYLDVDASGQIDLEALQHVASDTPNVLAAFGLANGETGVICPLSEIARTLHRCGGILFADLAQAAGRMPINVQALALNAAAFSAHKMHGPKGAGALYLRGGMESCSIEPLIVGGGQERGLRGGTLNVPAIVGFGEACRIARLEMKDEAERIAALRDHLELSILRALPNVTVNGDREHRLPNTCNLTFHGIDAKTLIRDLHDVAASTQAACSTGNSGPSHVLLAMGLSEHAALSAVRFSLGRFTTADEIDQAIGKITATVTRLRAL